VNQTTSNGEMILSDAVKELYSSLSENFRGNLLKPESDGYHEARVIWNGMVARKPALIARCADVADLQTAIRTASAMEVLTAVRCGGHSLAGFSTCDGGMVIDLSRLRQVTVDAKTRRARFAGGCLLGSVDTVTQAHGLAFPAGVVSHTGASGLILGGGFGWLTRLCGLSCDNITDFTLVTADGSVVHADTNENADLFWALRGGGGNFGVVTEFEATLHPVTSVLLGTGFCAEADIPLMLRRWREFMPNAPENLKWNISLRLAQPSDNLPPEHRGRPVASQFVLWVDDPDQGRPHVERAFSISRHIGVNYQSMSFLTLQTMADHEFPHGRRYYTKSGYFRNLNDSSIDKMVEATAKIPSPMTQVELAYLGGAASRVPAGETAFGDRSSPFVVNLLGNWSNPAEDNANISWVRNLFAAIRPAMTPGVYINFMSGDEDDRTPEAYRERWDRLVAIKSKYDPNNFFRLNQNIPTKNVSRKANPF
jgi:FAD binding domain-containing protein/berberine-like enzyme